MIIISGEIEFAFRDETNNILAMTYGQIPTIQTKQVIICKKNKFPSNRLGPFLLDPKKSQAIYTASVIGNQYEKTMESKPFENKYIAFIDEQIEIKPKLELFIALKEMGLFSLWEPEAPYNYFKGQDIGYLIVFRVCELEQPVDEVLLEKGRSGRNYYYRLSKKVAYDKAVPVIEDEVFEALKKQIIQVTNMYNKNEEVSNIQYIEQISESISAYNLESSTNRCDRIVSQYDRNQRISLAVKNRANGLCECCHREAPFIKDNGEPYLEEHHLIPLFEGGEDSINNVCAVCPNCHRELHYGKNRDLLKEATKKFLVKK